VISIVQFTNKISPYFDKWYIVRNDVLYLHKDGLWRFGAYNNTTNSFSYYESEFEAQLNLIKCLSNEVSAIAYISSSDGWQSGYICVKKEEIEFNSLDEAIRILNTLVGFDGENKIG
jgi:hypothetical protein